MLSYNKKTMDASTLEGVSIFIPKLMRAVLTVVMGNISTNYMSQVYIDKVLVNQENPPKLYNFVLLFVFLDFLMLIISSVITYVLITTLLSGTDVMKVMTNISIDFALGMMVTLVTGLMIATTMQNKKFFLYKDDGLRAIRALNDMMFKIHLFSTLFPFHMLRVGSSS